jgi:hypothetical protein
MHPPRTGRGTWPRFLLAIALAVVLLVVALQDRVLAAGDDSPIYEWNTEGDGEGQFDDRTAIAAAPDGSLYVSKMSNRVQKFTSEGVFVTKWGALSYSS